MTASGRLLTSLSEMNRTTKTWWEAGGNRAKCDIVAGGRGAPQRDQRRKLTAPRVLGTAYVKPMREPWPRHTAYVRNRSKAADRRYLA